MWGYKICIKEDHIIISTDVEEILDKKTHEFMIFKNPSELGIEDFLHLINSSCFTTTTLTQCSYNLQ